MKFSEKLKKLRAENNMTQDDLADKIFVTRTAISKWETDNGYPSIESLKLLAKLFGTSVDELISEEDIEQKEKLDKNKNKTYFVASLVCFAIALAFSLAGAFTEYKFLFVFAVAAASCFVFFAELSIPKEKRQTKISNLRFILEAIILGLVVWGFIEMCLGI